MTKKVCIFGSLFQEARSQTALSQWEISVRAGTHLSNVNQVEAGNQEPNVILAVKMLLAVNADIQSFFMELASLLSHCIDVSKIPSLSQKEFQEQLNSVLTPLEEAEIFGMLLSQCRSVTKLSQNYISSIAKYDHRSLQKVEKGTQLPGIINAVKLVMATGVDAGVFFDIFSEKLETIKVKKNMRAGTVKQCLFGSALVNIRESLQISQYQLAKRTGIAEEYLNKLENSKREPKARMIIRLGRGLAFLPVTC